MTFNVFNFKYMQYTKGYQNVRRLPLYNQNSFEYINEMMNIS